MNDVMERESPPIAHESHAPVIARFFVRTSLHDVPMWHYLLQANMRQCFGLRGDRMALKGQDGYVLHQVNVLVWAHANPRLWCMCQMNSFLPV